MFILLSLLATLAPPVAPKIPSERKLHGEKRLDDYAWLKDRENPQTMAYLKEENEYTEKMMADTKPLQETLYNEMKGRINECDTSVPIQKGEYFYYTRHEKDKSYAIYCRKKGNLCAPEEILFDGNEFAGSGFFSLEAFVISPDQNLAAIAFDREGRELNSLIIKDLQTKNFLPDQIPKMVGDPQWSSDGKTLFYLVADEILRPAKVFAHTLGSDITEDRLVFEETDQRFYLALDKSKDKEVIFILPRSHTSTEVYTLDPKNPTLPPRKLLKRAKDIKYFPEHHGGEFFVLTNQDAPDFQVMRLRDNKLISWIPQRRGIHIENFEVFNGYLALLERAGGLQQIEIVDLKTGFARILHFHEAVYALGLGSNPESKSTKLRFIFTSLVTPDSVYDFDMKNFTFELKKQEQVIGYCPAEYVQRRFCAESADGEEIPISLVYKKTLPIRGLLLCAYGAYGISYPMSFSSEKLSLLDRGVAFAIAHVRGGGEKGRRWYEEGRLLKKKNTFNDFIAAAQKLISCGLTDPSHLVIEGRSAGGLLIGAVLNMRPDLFRAAIAGVPFVDVINTMSDPTIPLTVNEYEEWGNPKDKALYSAMKSYSPYDNVKRQNYPALLITGGINDSRVGFWEPAKWAARLRATKKDSHLLFLKTEMGGGHFGCSGRYDALREEAFTQAFILNILKN